MSNKAREFFLTHKPEYINSEIIINKMQFNFTNEIFLLVVDNKEKFKVRLSRNNNLVSRSKEYLISQIIKDEQLLYFSQDNGNAIYKWIPGDNLLNININQNHLLEIWKLASNFHNCKIDKSINIQEHDHYIYESEQTLLEIPKIYKIHYDNLINKHKNLPLVLCHNDISKKNIIQSSDEKLFLIDYEWASLNSINWDLGNLIREFQLNKSQIYYLSEISKISYELLIDFAFIATFYALQLSFKFPKSDKLSDYRLKLLNYLENYIICT